MILSESGFAGLTDMEDYFFKPRSGERIVAKEIPALNQNPVVVKESTCTEILFFH
jgi:hypothetical protein